MLTRGEYRDRENTYGVICWHTKDEVEFILTSNGNVWSSYKKVNNEEYSYGNKVAKNVWDIIKKGLKGCTAKNVTAAPFVLGTVGRHRFTKTKIDFVLDRYSNELAGAEITGENLYILLEYTDADIRPNGIPYIKLTAQQEFQIVEDEADKIQVRTLEEISLEKDITWLKSKKYYIVNDDETAEKILSIIENWNGPIAYDTETTGLKINMFSKINSDRKRQLEEYNRGKSKDEQIRADRLVGIILCVEPNVSYYFPCFNRKFKNIYDDKSSVVRNKLINNIKARYTVGECRDLQTDMARYWRDKDINDVSSDCLLMERCRKILTEGHIVAHNGSFEWKVSHCYDIDLNLKDDTMLLHQILYKFRSTTSNRGEPSNLKYLTKREFGIDQLDLQDFFVDYKEDDSGEVRGSKKKKKKTSNIDFSYMDYNGARAYAPADGDTTLGLLFKYKRDMIENHKEQEYIYNVEVVVACAIGYMEFYGLKLDEEKINSVRDTYRLKLVEIEHEIRLLANLAEEAETVAINKLAELKENGFTSEELEEHIKVYRDAVESSKNPINLAAPAQVAKLFFETLGYPFDGDKMSVAKKAIKPLLKMKNEDGTNKCPAVHLYSEWKQVDTLLTKFFDNLQNFMYPGGFIFCSYGQISTATGRMSCIEENTLIRVVGGDKPIKDVKVGDLVQCYDEDGDMRIKRVLSLIDSGYRDCIKLKWGTKVNKDYGELICTPEHLIRKADGSWLRADKLEQGDELTGLSVNSKVLGKGSVGIRHVYDIEVEDCHNFMANGICVHNCSKPNAQQLPKSITKIVVPRENYVMFDADYSQIEYRTLVAMANEPFLLDLFKDPDNDYHTLMASLMYNVPYASVTPKMRSDAKSFNFGIPYGMGFKSLAILLTGMSGPSQVEEAKEKYELYFKDQPNVRKFFDRVKEMALVNKFTKTYWNRYRYYSFTDKDGNVSNSKKAMALRQAGNAVIQGCEKGDTLIQTKEYGIVKVEDVVDRHLHVWDGDKWSQGDILYSGKKRKCIVKFNGGLQFTCSPIHKFLVRSHRGTERFVECKDLLTKEKSKNPHRVVINREYRPSNYKYSSDWARAKYTSTSSSAKNVFLDDIGDSFKIGVVLGRLASDGNVVNNKNQYVIRQIVAEHEMDVLDTLRDYMEPLGVTEYETGIREGRTENIVQLKVHSKSLVQEVLDLDIRHQISDKIFADTEMLRGYLSGYFDGDGGISGKTIALTFGKQDNFEKLCKDIQKALAFFGIRSRYYEYSDRYKIVIRTYDNQEFLDTIGFISKHKQELGRKLEVVNDEHVFGKCLIVESVEITDEYIDMYDVCNTDGGYYVADGVITHNTAADIFKISVARNFTWIRRNGLLGKLLIVNMIHDEQLMEMDCDCVNTQAAFSHILDNMEFKVEGFPPLYIGAGFGFNWADAKGKMAEIHPTLSRQLHSEAENMSIWSSEKTSNEEVVNYYNNRVNQFRFEKVRDYLLDSNNFGKDLHPAIGNLINLQFTYGLEETLSGDELTFAALSKFIEVNGLDVDPNNFKSMVEQEEEVEEEVEYSDGEEEMDFEESDISDNSFALIDEDDKLFGVSLQELIKEFGLIVSKERKVCGVDVKIMPYKKKDELVDFLAEHQADKDEEGAMQVVFLMESNVLFNTGVWVKGIDGSTLSTRLKLNTLLYN